MLGLQTGLKSINCQILHTQFIRVPTFRHPKVMDFDLFVQLLVHPRPVLEGLDGSDLRLGDAVPAGGVTAAMKCMLSSYGACRGLQLQ